MKSHRLSHQPGFTTLGPIGDHIGRVPCTLGPIGDHIRQVPCTLGPIGDHIRQVPLYYFISNTKVLCPSITERSTGADHEQDEFHHVYAVLDTCVFMY